MMKVEQKQANNGSNRSATETSQSSWQNQLAQVVNNSKKALAQPAFIDVINDSSCMLAKRRQIESYIGTVQQHTIAPNRPTSQNNQQQTVQRAKRLDEEEWNPLAGNFAAQVPGQLEQTAPQPNKTGLPDHLKSGIESLSGLSMDNVRVHYNSSQPEQLNALAYAQGTGIHLAPGQEQHLPHEAWHMVQQAQPTMQKMCGVPVNDN
jgi:hypothetical protein